MRQVAPVCRRIGAYVLSAKRGINAVRLPKRIGKHRLGAGTYFLTGKSRGAKLFQARARIVRGRTLVLHRGGAVDMCEGATATAPASFVVAASEHGVKSRVAFGAPPRRQRPEPPGPFWRRSPLVRAISLGYAPDPLRPLLLAVLALAIALLSIAAVPQRMLPAGPAAEFVAERRGYIVAIGIWLLAIVAVVTTFA